MPKKEIEISVNTALIAVMEVLAKLKNALLWIVLFMRSEKTGVDRSIQIKSETCRGQIGACFQTKIL